MTCRCGDWKWEVRSYVHPNLTYRLWSHSHFEDYGNGIGSGSIGTSLGGIECTRCGDLLTRDGRAVPPPFLQVLGQAHTRHREVIREAYREGVLR